MCRHVDDINSTVLAACPRGAGPDTGEPPAGVGNSRDDANFIGVEVASTVRMNGVIEHMPIERAVGVVNLLTCFRPGSVWAPRHQHSVRWHDLDFVPAGGAVFRSYSQSGTNGVAADRVKKRAGATDQPKMVAVIRNIFLVGNLHSCVGARKVMEFGGSDRT